MSHTVVCDTMPTKVDESQGLFFLSVVCFELVVSFAKDLVNLGVISLFFCLNLILRKTYFFKISFHCAEISEHIWQVFKTAFVFILSQLLIIGYADEDS